MTQRDEGHNYRDSRNKAMEYERKNNILNNLEIVGDVLWLNYKNYEIRIEKTKSHNNNNLIITVHPDTESDYTHRLEVK
tara:strand:- start:126 stop:362 length:237 start_codon:yes stop_codon:yes gene_type:complete